MTLDKFGRHISKRPRSPTYEDTDTINVSNYIYSNLILKFESNTLLDEKFVLSFNKTSYSFPLQYAIIENVKLYSVNEDDDILISINEKEFLKEELFDMTLHENDSITFSLNTSKISNLTCLSAEIIIKCPVKFEKSTVQTERVQNKHLSQSENEAKDVI